MSTQDIIFHPDFSDNTPRLPPPPPPPDDYSSPSAQGDFFDNAAAPPRLDTPHRKRSFLYDGTYFEDPGPEYSAQDVLNFLAQSYPELEQGSWHSRNLPDGSEEITFVKVAGEKGATRPADITRRLTGFTPPPLAAIELVRSLAELERAGNLSADRLLALAPEIEVGLAEIDRIAARSGKVTTRCLALTPVSLPAVPVGF